MEKRGKRKHRSEPSAVSKETTAAAVLLAALSSQDPDSHRPILTKSLNKLRQSFHNPLFLSLLPTLLTRTSAPLASRAASILGSAALHSLDLNRTIASDADVIHALLSALSNPSSSCSVSACDALLDLCTTSVGRRCLIESSAIPAILLRFLRLRKSSTTSVIVCSVFSDTKEMNSVSVGFKEDELTVLILNAAIILINTCDIEQLEKIPGQLSQAFVAFLRNLWVKVRNAMSLASTMDCTRGEDMYVSNIRVSHVAESLFRLSICASQSVTPLPFHVVERGVFGLNETGFRDFVLNQWEVEPFLVRRLSAGGKLEDDDFFGPLSVNLVGQYPAFLSSVLSGMVSCLPISSDELNILTFLDEVQEKLGCHLIYQQDIRVVRMKSKKEVHFFVDSQASCSIEDPHCLSTEDVSKCEEAYKQGFTVALRGMEFRFDGVAAIVEGLATIFGQPSVGANMYLTPPNSQGLACHYDDHCVFVCQLVGTKRWRVSSQSNVQLPRLYDPLDRLHGSEVQNSMDDCKQYLLREGDILYIPRGVLHEACTETVSLDGSASCSLHITLGIEVEPPFGWEGFFHVAFFSWNQNQKQVNNSFESSSGVIHDICANLFLVAIGLLGDSDPVFRKACLVASILSGSRTHNWLDLNQRSVFCQLIDKINTRTKFLEVFRSIELAVLVNKDPLQRIKWLSFLNLEKESSPNHDQNMPFMGMKNLLSLCFQHKDHVEAAFQQLKSSFCENVIFEDAIVSYKVLLDKYRKDGKADELESMDQLPWSNMILDVRSRFNIKGGQLMITTDPDPILVFAFSYLPRARPLACGYRPDILLDVGEILTVDLIMHSKDLMRQISGKGRICFS